MVELKTMCCGEVICSGPTANDAVIYAVQNGVSLKDADLSEVDFSKIPVSIFSQIPFTNGMVFRYTYELT